MLATATIEDLTLNLTQEITIHAPLEASFAALLEQMGPANETPDGNPLPMKIEPWPGGRWYRDLGDDNGHHWGHVQAIKRPTLLEITGAEILSKTVEESAPGTRASGDRQAGQLPSRTSGGHALGHP